MFILDCGLINKEVIILISTCLNDLIFHILLDKIKSYTYYNVTLEKFRDACSHIPLIRTQNIATIKRSLKYALKIPGPMQL